MERPPPRADTGPSWVLKVTVGLLLLAMVVVAVVVLVPVAQRRQGGGPDDGVAAPASIATLPATRVRDTAGETSTTTAPPEPTQPTAPSTLGGASTTTTNARAQLDERSLAELLGEDRTAAQLRVPARPAGTSQSPFLFTFGDTPIGFDPCRTIHWKARVGHGPGNGLDLIVEALRRLGNATGLQFVYDGPTNDVPPAATNDKHDAVDIASAFEPLVVGWATRAETDLWDGEGPEALGVGGPKVVRLDSGDGFFVGGYALLLPDPRVTPTFGPGATMGNVLLHELAHAVGLGHAPAGTTLLAPALTDQTADGYGPSELAGLWALGASQGCYSDRISLR